MKDEHIYNQIDAYLDGELSEEERKKVESHLQSCADCMQLKENLVNAWSALDQWEEKEPPSDLKVDIMNAVRYEEKRKKNVFLMRYLLPAAAAIVIVITLFFSSLDTGQRTAVTHLQKVENSLQLKTIIADSSNFPDEEVLGNLSDEEMEFLESIDVISNIEYLYLIESEDQKVL